MAADDDVLDGFPDEVVGLKRALPPLPPACKPVDPPAIPRGTDARVALAKVGAALLQANGHLAACRDWYEAVRAQFAKG